MIYILTYLPKVIAICQCHSKLRGQEARSPTLASVTWAKQNCISVPQHFTPRQFGPRGRALGYLLRVQLAWCTCGIAPRMHYHLLHTTVINNNWDWVKGNAVHIEHKRHSIRPAERNLGQRLNIFVGIAKRLMAAATWHTLLIVLSRQLVWRARRQLENVVRNGETQLCSKTHLLRPVRPALCPFASLPGRQD